MTTARMAGWREARVAVGLWGQGGRWATVNRTARGRVAWRQRACASKPV